MIPVNIGVFSQGKSCISERASVIYGGFAVAVLP
jgi:hypothetical protein